MSSFSAEPMSTTLTSTLASRLASIALSHVRREYPNKLDHVLSGPEDAQNPRALHPLFYGSFDWHSCVHSYWLLATLHRVCPGIPEAGALRELLDDALTPEKIAGECDYLARPTSAAFERPYGWAWLLALQAELMRQKKWAHALKPLADSFVQRFREWLPRATYPVRAGTHGNTAFALRLALDFAHTTKDDEFAGLLRSAALHWYAKDADCQCWEPSGEDFLSSALTEAQCMGAALAPEQFREWFARFLPRLAEGEPASLFEPAWVSDRSDGRIVHLDGLNLSRAWSWAEIAALLEPADPVRVVAINAAQRHLSAALPSITGDYVAEHWLATYALLGLRAVMQIRG
jgi:hypothetical protein